MKKLPSKSKVNKAKAKVSAKVASPKATSAKSAKSTGTGKKASGNVAGTKAKPSTGKPLNKATKTASAGKASSRKAAKNSGTKTAAPAKTATPKLRVTTRKTVQTISAKNVRPAPKKSPVKSVPVTGTVSTVRFKSKSGQRVSVPVVISSPPPPPEPMRRQISSGSLRAFEHAVKVFNRRQFDDALEMFDQLLTRYQNDVEVAARAQMYIQVCKQKLQHSPTTPRNAEELYDRGVFALNVGDFPQARNFFEKALRLRPDEPYLLYSLAATLAQVGSTEQALDYLKRSIQIQPRLRSQAYNDADFSGLRENKRFLDLLGLTSPFDRLESRR